MREQRRIVEQNDRKSRNNRMGGGGGEAVEGCKEGRSAAALLLEAIICSDTL